MSETTAAERAAIKKYASAGGADWQQILRIFADLEAAEERAQKAEAWSESALKDYERLREWLHARGVTEWEDTLSAVLKQVAGHSFFRERDA